MSGRRGSLYALVPADPNATGPWRTITCPGCGDTVGVLELKLTPNATGTAMRPDVCGTCQPVAHRLEPAVQVRP